MSKHLVELFTDPQIVKRIKSKLPKLFQLAELDCSRAGKVGMEVGSVREKIIVALFIYKFGEANVETEIPITEPEVDALLFGNPVSIKTITSKGFGGVKLIWTVDAEKAKEFRENYYPTCDIVLVQINWGGTGGLFYIPVEVQRAIFDNIGRNKYIKLPVQGTNPRGAEFTAEALSTLAAHNNTIAIPIDWQKSNINFNPYKRWVDLWSEN
jgi:hypothetical protein